MFNERIDNEDITLIRGESLSIDVYLTFDSGEPVTHAQIPASKIKSCMWLQNGIRIPLIATELNEESCYNLRSDIDTRSIKGDSFLVNVAIEEFTDTAPDDINIATFNQTFYLVNSATDVDIPLPDPSPSSGGHSVVYQLDGQFYACQNYEEGQIITPIVPEVETGYEFTGWSGIPDIMPDHCLIATGKMVPTYHSDGLFYVDINENECYVAGIGSCTDRIITVPSIHEGKTVVKIGQAAFFRNGGLTQIRKMILPDTIREIGAAAFHICRELREINIPDNCLFIDTAAFEGCSSLASFVVPDECIFGSSRILAATAIREFVYPSGSTDIKQEFFRDSSIESFKIPPRVQIIYHSAFRNCQNLTSIYIPKSVVSIYSEAFDYCLNLTDVYYAGTESEWNNIDVYSNNEALANATKHFSAVW